MLLLDPSWTPQLNLEQREDSREERGVKKSHTNPLQNFAHPFHSFLSFLLFLPHRPTLTPIIMSIIYALIAKGNTILTEYSTTTGNFTTGMSDRQSVV
jgi:hypothetical protein